MMMMFGFLRKALAIQLRFSLSSSASSTSLQIRTLPFLQRHLSPFSSSSEAHSFTVSHLVNSYGFSRKQALWASKIISFKSPEKPDSVFAFFDSHGFSKSQILKIIRSRPQLLVSDPQKSLFPKLQFFYAKGASKPEVAKIVALCPNILISSLENQIIPRFNFLKDFCRSEEMALSSVKRFPRLLVDYRPNCLESNINALEECGVPKSNVAALLSIQPRALIVRSDQFREVLEEVKEMGFDPSKKAFCIAVQGLRGMSKSTWEKKIDAFKVWGWSEEQIRLAFLKSPWCMIFSQDKIMATMDFLVNKMGKDSSLIARLPVLLNYSLEKRIIPRYSVVQVLLSNGLINEDFNLVPVIQYTEKMFLDKFVNVYKEEAPQLLNLYQKKVGDSNKPRLSSEAVPTE